MNFSQTLEKLMDENGVTAYKLMRKAKGPPITAGFSFGVASLCD